ncbi:MAG TPA: DUF4199 family protein [Pyrinomonadaceae bacterium]|nr:DUF4199 family protein [Pyrinomonadaceae bacterium]
MRIPIKYGLLIALGLIIWVVLAHQLVANPQSPVHTLIGPVFFNILHFVMIFLGIKELERVKGDRLRFKEALKTGISIAFVYALAASLFFVGVVLVVGTRWLAIEPGAATTPTRLLLVQAFAALFLGSIFLGLIYSTVISFFVAKRRSES